MLTSLFFAIKIGIGDSGIRFLVSIGTRTVSTILRIASRSPISLHHVILFMSMFIKLTEIGI